MISALFQNSFKLNSHLLRDSSSGWVKSASCAIRMAFNRNYFSDMPESFCGQIPVLVGKRDSA